MWRSGSHHGRASDADRPSEVLWRSSATCPCGERTTDEQVLVEAFAAAVRMAGLGRLNTSMRRACSIAACVALAMRTLLSSAAAHCCTTTVYTAAWATTFLSAALALRPTLLVVSQALLWHEHILGFLLLRGRMAATVASGMAAAASFGAVALYTVRAGRFFGRRWGKMDRCALDGRAKGGEGCAFLTSARCLFGRIP